MQNRQIYDGMKLFTVFYSCNKMRLFVYFEREVEKYLMYQKSKRIFRKLAASELSRTAHATQPIGQYE
jgi:hypothetical protein